MLIYIIIWSDHLLAGQQQTCRLFVLLDDVAVLFTWVSFSFLVLFIVPLFACLLFLSVLPLFLCLPCGCWNCQIVANSRPFLLFFPLLLVDLQFACRPSSLSFIPFFTLQSLTNRGKLKNIFNLYLVIVCACLSVCPFCLRMCPANVVAEWLLNSFFSFSCPSFGVERV